MLIDFHVHTFPDAIAEKTLAYLLGKMRDTYKVNQKINYGGTPSLLLESMKENEVDISVVMPIATKPSQYASINKFAKEITCDKIISFGTIHPQDTDIEYKVSELFDMGFTGIKLHPEYQGFFINSPEGINVLKIAEKLGLYTMLHAGRDLGMPEPVHCSPEQLKDALGYVSGKFIIAAHMGGYQMGERVLEHLAGSEIFIDTCYYLPEMEKGLAEEIIKKHGANKVLFASDSPWAKAEDILISLKNLGLSSEDFEKITYKNAMGILNI